MKKVVIITGVLGGIGNATAEVFNTAGWHVVGVDKRQNNDAVDIPHFICADISDHEIPLKIISEVSSREGRLDALINNAAVQICKSLLETSVGDWEQTMAINVRSAFLMTQAAYPLLKKNKGSIVNISSVHAFATSQGMAAYAASKGALSALTRATALELAPDGIRVNSIAPGAVDTGMLRHGLTRGHIDGKNLQEMVKKIGDKHPQGRVAKPEEIGTCVLFLADGHQSSFITGQSISVDGGALAKLSTE